MGFVKKINILLLPVLSLGVLVFAPASVHAAPCDPGSGGASSGATNIFTPWYEYLPGETDADGKCAPTFDYDGNGDTSTDELRSGIVAVVVAVVELLTRISALVAVGFVIYGAVQYIASQGDQQNIANAKSTITNALIGFVITVLAIGIVQFLGRAVQ